MMLKLREWFSIKVARQPGRVILAAILIFNILFIFLSSVIISHLSLDGTENMNFLEAAFCTMTMILDAGCISFVVSDIGHIGVGVAILCLMIIIIGMISFTGAVIGYITNSISDFIDSANSGGKKLALSGHVVLLNWNVRAPETVNDLLFSDKSQKVVILSSEDPEKIREEINDRLLDTIHRENNKLKAQCRDRNPLQGWFFYHKNKLRNKVTVIVRRGDVFVAGQLRDLCVDRARTIILFDNGRSSVRRREVENPDSFREFEKKDWESREKGNALTIKTLMQVIEMVSNHPDENFPTANPPIKNLPVENFLTANSPIKNSSTENSTTVIVEVMDSRTGKMVEELLQSRRSGSGCRVVPVNVNQLSGQILSQFSLIPELSLVYGELFSNKGVAFYSRVKEENCRLGESKLHQQGEINPNRYGENNLLQQEERDLFQHGENNLLQQEERDLFQHGKNDLLRHEIDTFKEYFESHNCAIPLSLMQEDSLTRTYYAANREQDIDRQGKLPETHLKVQLNQDYWIGKKKVILLGHNSRCIEIMEGFCAFRQEWNFRDGSDEILEIVVIDSRQNLEKMNYYKEYPFVIRTVEANLYDSDLICDTIRWFTSAHKEDTSILILSDDTASGDAVDENVLMMLIYIQKIIGEKLQQDPDFEESSIDVIAEIMDPRHYNVVKSCGIQNVVISNRYISKMMTQIGEKESLFIFYKDILTYDLEDEPRFTGKELYAKKVKRFFKEIPEECTAYELIRAVYLESLEHSLSGEELNPVMTLGYLRADGQLIMFGGNQCNQKVRLHPEDRLIVISNH